MTLIVRYKLVVLLILSLVVFSCTYEKIEITDELPQNVSFQNDLIPLFNQSCNSIGCHNTGGIPPDLSVDNSYQDLTTIANMIDLESPENSTIYVRMIDTQSPMPLSGVMNYESQQVLAWIKEGAQNN
ncbi:MAG: hypothetical protein GQ527_13180 [Bacteroidales bacterium]|nr:hypothetical protein [Bacteroidales bacterium]